MNINDNDNEFEWKIHSMKNQNDDDEKINKFVDGLEYHHSPSYCLINDFKIFVTGGGQSIHSSHGLKQTYLYNLKDNKIEILKQDEEIMQHLIVVLYLIKIKIKL